jgi:hypothetical protein
MLDRYRTKAGGPVQVWVNGRRIRLHRMTEPPELGRELLRRYGPGKLLHDGTRLEYLLVSDARYAQAVDEAPAKPEPELPDTGVDLEADVDSGGADRGS